MDATRLRAWAWTAGIAALCGLWFVQNGAPERLAAPQPSPAEAFVADPGPRSGSTVAAPLRASEPVRIRIPRIGVDAPLTRLGLGTDGSLDVPPAEDRNLAGWFGGGTPPGAKGTAIVAGHVDNAEGPAVFYSLGSLKKGAAVEIDRRDGRTAVFTVDAVEVYANEDFPDERVYGASANAALRLITCGGGYTRATGYQGNVVAYAHLAGVR
ncbi:MULTISPECIES: class F sortase [unclassified Streptomyces]|uniref:class F sortase n=1 Tax=unclassified Streptomyces TaxID=2593676 RepID=UPI0001C18EB0|nr:MULTISPECIES: class F sortase [unclassified Streptomyces]MYR64795.1 class F sortase [Streptomyces sp. SID4939]MYS01553.1 class F sortase [Streptomyces sp. SID4940]MYT64307.1 class F sortase [Streptomyces sp. SID8357]MYT87120.1 class F sortase [Streptomyces sp. SID8360]MYW37317.1 class F sortase [Streptomyces sp. SID1]